jgi:glycine cleavage system pyridoxal-binding protein P
MSNKKIMVHPYIPNSVPSIKEEMLRAVGAETVEEFYADIPERLRLKRKLDLPDPLLSESELVHHIEGLLAKNSSTRDCLSFLGAFSGSEDANTNLRLYVCQPKYNGRSIRGSPECLVQLSIGTRPVPGSNLV